MVLSSERELKGSLNFDSGKDTREIVIRDEVTRKRKRENYNRGNEAKDHSKGTGFLGSSCFTFKFIGFAHENQAYALPTLDIAVSLDFLKALFFVPLGKLLSLFSSSSLQNWKK